MAVKFTKFAGIKDAGDKLSTGAPYLREADNVDLDDLGKIISRRQGHGATITAGAYHSLWPRRGITVLPANTMLGVTGTTLKTINVLTGATTTIRSGLTAGLEMEYVEVDGKIYYSNGVVYGFIDNLTAGTFPTISKFGGTPLPAGQMLEFYGDRMYAPTGGLVPYSEPWDFGRSAARKDWLRFPGQITMWKAVKDGIYCSYDGSTVFLSGRKPSEFIVVPVADYAALRGTAVKFDASLISSNTPLQGDAVYWYSEQGPCIGLAGGLMINHALTKYDAPTGNSGAAVCRETTKGFMQALSIIQS